MSEIEHNLTSFQWQY